MKKTIKEKKFYIKIKIKDEENEELVKYKIVIEVEVEKVDNVIDYATGKKTTMKEISFSGDIYATIHQRGRYKKIAAGQMNVYIKKILKKCKINNNDPHIKDLLYILDIWEKYHLNTLRPGTKKQMEFLEKYARKNNLKLSEIDYNKAVKILKEANLYEDKNFIVDGKPYKYGEIWLAEKIDDRIIENIFKIPSKFSIELKINDEVLEKREKTNLNSKQYNFILDL